LISSGVFTYSKEDGTPAAKLAGQVHHNTKKKRQREIMKLQQRISEEKNKEHIGKKYKVLIEGNVGAHNCAHLPHSNYYIGRTYMDIPDMDGVVFIKSDVPSLEDKFVECKIVGANGYDLVGEIV